MKRIIAAVIILFGFGIAWQMLAVTKIKVVGQPSSTGYLSTDIEQPFFKSLQNETGLPIELEFKTLDQLGVKDTHQLPMMKEGIFDLVSLRLIQNSQNEVSLNGLDITGLNLNMEKGRTLANAYLPVVDRHLQEKFRVKTLGIWTFGPQELFCSKSVQNLSDLKGLKIRVAGELLAEFIGSLGAVPAIIPFDETANALKNKLVDCAISSAASAGSAGWLNYTKYYIPVSFNTGINAYAISLPKWNMLNEKQQVVLQKAFDKHIQNMWVAADDIYQKTQQCIEGKDSCNDKYKYSMIRVNLSKQDLDFITNQSKATAFKRWADICNREYAGCSDEWLNLVGPISGLR